MTTDASEGTTETLAPDEAFSALGNEIRMNILRLLGEHDGPMSFSELREQVGIRDSGRFNYHLNQLTGHFIKQSDEGYRLHRPGERMVEAVLSGAVMESPNIDRTDIDWSCHYCGTRPVEMAYREEQVGVFCTDCSGMVGGESDGEPRSLPEQEERLYYAHLPPAGITGRSPEEIVLTAVRWTTSEIINAAYGICPRCSARLDQSGEVCPSHVADDGLCASCNRRFAIVYQVSCTTCPFEIEINLGSVMLANLEMRKFLLEHGLNPVAPRSLKYTQTMLHYDEEIRSADPIDVTVTFEIDGDTISFTFEDELSVVEAPETLIGE